ncbi:MAG: PEP-CTERM sorting domain-containing protein [Planctomycetota bacterium]|nr:PEP-CTERM sorting domain-containing protein [Planctomycetota bacterium]
MMRSVWCLSLALAAGSAQAAFFSFASDRNNDGPTFTSGNSSVSILDGRTRDGNNTVLTNFLVDVDENGPVAEVAYDTRFQFTGSLANYQVTSVAGTNIHAFTVNGSFEIIANDSNAAIFTATFTDAVFTSISESRTLLGRTANISADDTTNAVTFTTAGPLANIDVSGNRNFNFTLTALQTLNGARVGVSANGLLQDWISEGSFSAQAIPTPGSLALAVLGVAGMARRRR